MWKLIFLFDGENAREFADVPKFHPSSQKAKILIKNKNHKKRVDWPKECQSGDVQTFRKY